MTIHLASRFGSNVNAKSLEATEFLILHHVNKASFDD